MKISLWALIVVATLTPVLAAQEDTGPSKSRPGAALGSPIESPPPMVAAVPVVSAPRIVRASSIDVDNTWSNERSVADVIGAQLPEVQQGLAVRAAPQVNRFGFRAE